MGADEPAANQNGLGEEKDDEESPFCSRYRDHNRYGSCMGNKLGRTQQEGDCRVNCGRSTVVYAVLLQRRQTTSAPVRRFQPGRYLGRSSENTWRCACPRAYAPARRTSYG